MHVSGQYAGWVSSGVENFNELKTGELEQLGEPLAAGKQGGSRVFRLSLRRRLRVPHLAGEG